MRRVRLEYAEMPGLRLTATQAVRLFALRDDICARILDELTREAYLARDQAGSYLRTIGRP